ncbi:MAG: hypothetical protein HYV02_01600 [Deltaproteobacteria bacterium]|nr:hypothetical protein [Deltaproteobacteria bacterium]
MIELPNGHRLEYVAASGALAFDGRGWWWEWPLRWCGLLDPSKFAIVIKTVTRRPRRGNLRWSRPWEVVRLLKGGVVNAIGLTNPGIAWWCRTVGTQVPKRSYRLIGSIYGESPEEIAEMASMLDTVPLVAVEVNCSCPNVGARAVSQTEAILAAMEGARQATQHPLIAKLSVAHDYCAIARGLQGKVSAIAINSVPWAMACQGAESPLAQFGGGGVSGRAAQLYTWRMLQELVDVTSIPVIGPSVWTYEDIGRLRRLGARAISFGSIFLRYPWRPTAYVRREQREHSCARMRG